MEVARQTVKNATPVVATGKKSAQLVGTGKYRIRKESEL